MTTPTPFTIDEALAYVATLRAELTAANARAQAAEARLAAILERADNVYGDEDPNVALNQIKAIARAE